MGKIEPIFKDVFKIEDKHYSVFLFPHQLAWCPQKKGGEDMSEWINVKLKDIICADVAIKANSTKSSNCCLLPHYSEKKSVSYPIQMLQVTFAQAKKDSDKWQDVTLELIHNEYNLISKWAQTIQYLLGEFKERPKNLLIFINPFGGRRAALQIHEKHIKPILQLSRVKCTVIETNQQNHVTQVLKEMSDNELLEYDAVVAVGGDGTICEVVNGLLTRSNKGGIILESDLKPAPLPVAVIPAGSTNALAFTLNGTDDPRTAILHIVLGGLLPLDVASVQNNNGIERFIVGQMSYGFLADILLQSENLRWMGPKRYDYAGFMKLLEHAEYEGSIDMKQTDDVRKPPSQCSGGKGCEDCCYQSKPSKDAWTQIMGKFIGISAANISLRCPMSRLGMAPFAHLSDGCMELILIRKASRFDHLRYLLRTAGDSRTGFTLPFVERYRVKEFIFTPTPCNALAKQSISFDNQPSSCKCDPRNEKSHSIWNCDGELLLQSSVKVCIHANLIQVLARNDIPSGMKTHNSIDLDSCATLSSTVVITRSPSVATEASVFSLQESV